MRYKATVAYDGTAYQGWQRQINGLGIQEVLENALEKILGVKTPVTGSGRTDAGVHARGQVFHFDGKRGINYFLALNTILPKDIRIRSVEPVSDDFHARFSATKKRYDYFMSTDSTDPFLYKYRWIRYKRPDVDKMREGATYLTGTHDFTSFTNCHIDERKSRVKTVSRLEILEEGSDVHFIFEGNGFLRYQVRMMVGVLEAAGRGKIRPEDIGRMLEMKNKEASRYNAPAQGLFLVEVEYGAD